MIVPPGTPISARLSRAGLALVAAIAALGVTPRARAGETENPFARIEHFVIIYAENLSFNAVFGRFPGAEGLDAAQDAPPQVDTDGSVLPRLPKVRFRDLKSNGVETYLDAELPNAPFEIERYLKTGEATGDLVHRYYQQIEQIDGGRNDRFAAVSDAGGLVMGNYRGDDLALWKLARTYTLADHFHHAAFGGSFLNHFWLICACTPRFDEALLRRGDVQCGTDESGQPKLVAKIIACLDPKTGSLMRAPNSPASALDGPPVWVNDAQVTPDGYAVNTLQPAFPPYADSGKEEDRANRLPPQPMPTIGDRLDARGVSWAWYAEGWNDALAGKIAPYRKPENFQPHHQPFNYFARFAPGQPGRAHLKDENDLLEDIRNDTLPAVAFYKPVGQHTMHPGYTDIWSGDAHIAGIIEKFAQSPAFATTAIIITVDENGGAWDHVPPPKGDRWGPGSRVPMLVVSPLAKRGFVDDTIYDTTSLLKTIEVRFGLEPLGTRDADAADLRNAFEPPAP